MSQYAITGRTASEIATSIESGVDLRKLEPGERLPSVRALAASLSVSPTTIASAYASLRGRGIIITRQRSRSYVGWRAPLAGSGPQQVVRAGIRDLASGNPDPALLPDLKRALRRLEPPVRLYGEAPVVPALLDLARHELASAGLSTAGLSTAGLATAGLLTNGLSTGAMTVLSGALDGIERLLLAELRPGDAIVVEDPGYPAVFDLARALGLALRPVGLDEEGMRPEALTLALQEGVKAVLITPRGQNPTGATLTPGRAQQLREVLGAAPDVLLIEDDYLGPVTGAPRETAIGPRERWAALRSVGKSLGPDLRLAILFGDERTISRVEGRQRLGPLWVSHLLQHLVAALWADPGVTALLERATLLYSERREQLIAALASHGIRAAEGKGLNVWIPVPEELAVVGNLLQAGWAVGAGAPYRLDAHPAIRVTISTLDAHDARALARDIAHALTPTRRTRTA